MSRIINFHTLPVYEAAPAQGAAVAATFPFPQFSMPRFEIADAIRRLFDRWTAARETRRNIDALAVLSDNQLRDIGLRRANIVSAATGTDKSAITGIRIHDDL
jgi:uncharacterized protein YjiS (DUF1127 family)